MFRSKDGRGLPYDEYGPGMACAVCRDLSIWTRHHLIRHIQQVPGARPAAAAPRPPRSWSRRICPAVYLCCVLRAADRWMSAIHRMRDHIRTAPMHLLARHSHPCLSLQSLAASAPVQHGRVFNRVLGAQMGVLPCGCRLQYACVACMPRGSMVARRTRFHRITPPLPASVLHLRVGAVSEIMSGGRSH